VFDACANGQQIKCLTVIDEYTRECLAIDVAGSIRSPCVIEVLAKLVSIHGASTYLRSDNGPAFVSRAILKWLTSASIDTAHTDSGKPPCVIEVLAKLVGCCLRHRSPSTRACTRRSP